ncbi:hypothetical protein C3B44_09235 [Corynebacterium yudongzhengii]|uniref:Uncharacterized protein n=1 Tax=Corynebacterium yudongzhengii TaxID=2080740 RepID=A0A2U1T8T9_9CORY|nr:hypothetical protein [Corynebacterium yudongzhengii]AWB82510.1 hypothetical protein C3B44_09235 [Corynebacterium yudongzhengii]PWC02434.1 hypothetical protein DF222_02035 [Corynebacterium yudongzhengii]
MGTTATAIIIAILAGIGTVYTWDTNKLLSLALAAVTMIAGIIGTVGAFISALGLFFKLLPLVLVGVGIYLIYKVVQKNRDEQPPVKQQ